ncbi:MAG: hypothetical protein WCF23_10360 [Candidatus Nitrosopolaris sp.]
MASSFAPNKDDKSSGKNKKNSSASNKISIITDEPITDAPDFEKYSETLSNIIVKLRAEIHSWDIRWMGNREDHYHADDTKASC